MYNKIMLRMEAHLNTAQEHYPNKILFHALQGSQTYGLDYEGSDVDTKMIVLPSLEDICRNSSPISHSLAVDDEQCDVKDLRVMKDCFLKQNPNFLEILYSPNILICDPLFKEIVDMRDEIAAYDNYRMMNAMYGMGMQKRKALCHPYPKLKEKIDKYGYDPKQLSHLARSVNLMYNFSQHESFGNCIVNHSLVSRDEIMNLKLSPLPLEEALMWADSFVETMDLLKENYQWEHTHVINQETKEKMDEIVVNILKAHFAEEVRR